MGAAVETMARIIAVAAISLLIASANAYDLGFSEDVRAFIEGTEHLKAIVELAEQDEAGLAQLIVESPLAAIASNVTVGPWMEKNNSVPLVVAHGMGDSCFNPGMQSITKSSGNHLGVYSTCIPTGGNWITDTIGGFRLSQGNNVIRGYITKYNDPPVRNFMSICGINAGVGAFPSCSPQIPVAGAVCKALTEVLGALAYNPLSQGILFQADYFRDPSRVNASSYLKHSQLAEWNNEATVNPTYKANWAKTDKFVWVMGTEDTVVWPREGEQWGAMSTVPGEEFKTVNAMKDTRWYKEDTFGLKTADEAGKNHFESFKGEHIRMTETELFSWFDKYFN